jgi:phosphoribosylaminoimidazole (AIR) synthetase
VEEKMDNNVDDYISKVIGEGDEGSKLLAAICAETLRNKERVEILQPGMNGISVLRIPETHYAVVHSIGADPKIKDMRNYTESLVDRLLSGAEAIGAEPVAFADVVDAREAPKGLIELIGNSLVRRANYHNIPIVNGELAVLGNRVVSEANLSGTMLSIIPKSGFKLPVGIVPGFFTFKQIIYAVFDPKGLAIYINSDGVGTKTEFGERNKDYLSNLFDSLAMKLDDLIKIGATARVVSDVVETKGNIPFAKLAEAAIIMELYNKGITYLLQQENVGNRIMGYNESVPSLNISGSSVSTIDEDRLNNPLKPSEGEYLIAIKAKGPRSNGITAKRETMVNLFGKDWHLTPEGRIFMPYLSSPSILFYPVFKQLIDSGLATSVYHMSGGAYDSKLAKQIAKHGLYADIGKRENNDKAFDDLFPPDWREVALAAYSLSIVDAHRKYPMGNEGFVTTKNPDEAIRSLKEHGLEARVVAQLEIAKDGETGIRFRAYNGQEIYFSGKK